MTILTPEQFKEIYGQKGIDSFKPMQTPLQSKGFLQETKEDISQTIGSLKSTLSGTREKIGDIAETEMAGGQSRIRSLAQTFGIVAGGISEGIGDLFTGAIKTVLPEPAEEKVKAGVQKTIESIVPVATKIDEALGSPVGTFVNKYQQLDDTSKKDADAFLGVFQLALDIATAGATKKIGEIGVKKAGEVAVRAGKEVVETTANIAEHIAKKAPELGKKATKLLASEPTEQVKTILKETPVSKIDEFVEIARMHSIDQRALSGFEKVGDKMSDAAKQLQSQLSAIGKQKTALLQKAKTGLVEFTEAPRKAILEVMKLEDNVVKKQIINKLKSVKTKLDADRVIDEIQDMIYTGGRDLTLPKGSRIEKQLRGIVGKLNEELEKSLPTSYRKLNKLYSDKIKIVNTLNRALGEVVDGVATRGSGLVKQFFSPAGQRTKELFEYIKKTTGIDLAQDATLAKFAEELFDNPNVKSLLSGIPKSRAGAIDKTIDFTVEKTGLGVKIKKVLRKGAIEKAKDIATKK